MASDVPMLRYMVLSALIGFFVFCASYTVLVWKKRRQSANPVRVSGRLRGWSITFIVLGLLGVGLTFAIREAVRADGMLGGEGLYAVRSSADMRNIYLAAEGPVKEGDVLARFVSPGIQSEIDDAEVGRDRLKSAKVNLADQPLPPNQEHGRLHSQAGADRLQLRQALAFVKLSSPNQTSSIAIQRDTFAKLQNELKVVQAELAQANSKFAISGKQLKRERDFAAKSNISQNDLNEREKEYQSLEIEVVKLTNRIKATEDQISQCKESIEKLTTLSAKQGTNVSDELEKTKKDLAIAEEKYDKLEKQLGEDVRIAQRVRDNELTDIDLKIKQADIQLLAKQNKLEVKAPCDGLVIFRHPSPGTAVNQGTVLVLSPPEGLRFRFRAQDSQIEALRNAGTIMVELDETANSIEQRFPGKFLAATPLRRESGMSLVELECQVPPETVAAMAEAKPIKARFSWRPPLINMSPLFPIAIILLGVGVLGLFLTSLSGWKPNWPKAKIAPVGGDDEDSIVTYARPPSPVEGDTAEVMAETIPERPLLPGIPKEVLMQPWEHPVGIRLREAIIREDVSPELLNAVDMAIEYQQDAVIVPMREALRRAPTVPDHARRLLDKLNSCESADEAKQIAQRQLAQRITFLLYTVGMEIPNRVRTAETTATRVAAGVGNR